MSNVHGPLTRYPSFDTLEDFYRQSPERRYSGEADYGVHWTLPEQRILPWQRIRYRVSYVRNTGEIYVIPNLSPSKARVFVIGQVPADPVDDEDNAYPRQLWYSTLENILDGWAGQCAKPGQLQWLLERLAPHPPTGTHSIPR